MPYELTSKHKTRSLAKALAKHLLPGDLVVLSGTLGSGKTFFVTALCDALGMAATERVTSPTFGLVHEYASTRPAVAHADLYRLKYPEELYELGLEALREAGHLVLVEWGEPYIAGLGGDALIIQFDLNPRRASWHASGQRSENLSKTLSQSLEIRAS